MRAFWSMVVICLVAATGMCSLAGAGRDQRMTLEARRMAGTLVARNAAQDVASRRTASPTPRTSRNPELPAIVVAPAPAAPRPAVYWSVRTAFDSVAAATADYATRSARGPPIV